MGIKKRYLISFLVSELRKVGSWCGETHIQKTAYLLQEMLNMNLGFNFILYKYGPFSFDLRDELQQMLADEWLTLESNLPYGPSFNWGKMSKEEVERIKSISSSNQKKIKAIAKEFGSKEVTELEKLATAFYVSQDSRESADKRAKHLHDLKPHIPIDSALEAIIEIDKFSK